MKNTNRLLILALFPLLVGIANAQTLTLPSGTVVYSNITIGSWAGSPSRYVQQVITLNLSKYKAAGLQYTPSFANFEFTYENGTVVPSWIESNISGNLIIWINITNTTTQIELDIFNSTTNELSSSGASGIGESSQLSSNYDDGGKVFSSYNSTASPPLAPPPPLAIPPPPINTIIPIWIAFIILFVVAMSMSILYFLGAGVIALMLLSITAILGMALLFGLSGALLMTLFLILLTVSWLVLKQRQSHYKRRRGTSK